MKRIYIISILTLFSLFSLVQKNEAQSLVKDKPYKIGDFLICSPDTMKIDYIIKGEPSKQRISTGDTLYEDNKHLILGNANVLMPYYIYGIFKKYTLPYNFSKFEVPLYKGKLASPNFKTDTASWLFRTQIRNQCRSKGINFAGHFTIVEWGCGSACKEIAIVDRINGKINYSGILTNEDDSFFTLEYKRNSNLVVMNDWMMKEYKGYLLWSDNWKLITVKWENTKFRILR